MNQIPDKILCHSERQFSPAEVAEIIDTIRFFPNLSRKELVETICEHMSWFAPTGSYKSTACEKFLVRLEKKGWISLPQKQVHGSHKKPPALEEEAGNREEPGAIVVGLRELGPVELELVESKDRHAEWIRLVARYHYLGYKKPFGCVVRYFITSNRGIVGCVQYAGAAKAIAVRDQWIGWSVQHKRKNRGWVINNNRFLLFPWVTVKNLASHALGQVSRRIANDWQQLWGYRPVLMETFVDPTRYRGSSYRGAGWLYVGLTSGTGLVRAGRQYTTSPRMVFVHPLQSDFRTVLCSDNLVGRVFE